MTASDIDPELETRSRKVSERLSEALQFLSHEPSLALYRLQEHVRKSLPSLVEKKIEANKLHNGLAGACFDVDNAICAVEDMKRAAPVFQHIHEMLKTSMFLKQQLDYERARRENKRTNVPRMDSAEMLFQELRKTKSLGHLKRSGSAYGERSESSIAESILSRSTMSTPVSDMPCPSSMSNSRDVSDDQLWLRCRQPHSHDGTSCMHMDDPQFSSGRRVDPAGGHGGGQSVVAEVDEDAAAGDDDDDDDDDDGDGGSSTPTSGADSHVSEDAIDKAFVVQQTSPPDDSQSTPVGGARRREHKTAAVE